MNRREKEGTQANITRFFEGSVGAGAFAPRVRNAAAGPSGKKKGTGAAGKRLGAALSKLAEREGARGVASDDEIAEEADVPTGDEDAAPSKASGRKKRKAASKAAPVPDEDVEEDEDELYEEPTKKKPRKTRKGKGVA
jgi:DNA excision repair protein ERCC-5